MSSDVIARVDAFNKKAEELAEKGHLLRAAENFGRAAAAARALGADNLVTVHMLLRQSNLNGCFSAASADTADPRIRAAKRDFVTLLSDAVEALERRRVAGTLLDGKCAAAEEAWLASMIESANAIMPASEVASLAALVGYEVFLRAASDASRVVSFVVGDFPAACSVLQSFAQHVVHAAELMQQPRRHSDVALPAEADFTKALRDAVAKSVANGHGAYPLVQQLADALRRLEHSGVLQPRAVEEGIAELAPKKQAFLAAVQKSLTAPGLRTCALPGCGAREAHPAHFKSCAACRTVVYCCREHQVAGWPSHKKACKAARKAQAEEDGAGPSDA